MAVYDLEEQEKIDDLKAWWAQYGKYVSIVVTAIAIVVIGVQGWRWYQRTQAEQASVLYQAVSDAARAQDAAKAKDPATQIVQRYAGTAYAPRAALLYAKMLYDSGDRDGAKAQYTWAAEHAKEDEIQAIARFRLAQVQVDQKQYDAALATLDAKHPDAFDGVFADLRGDALAAAGRVADARTAYETALAKLDSKSPYRTYVQVKHDTLGSAAPAAAATPTVPPAASTPAAADKGAPAASAADTGKAPKGTGK